MSKILLVLIIVGMYFMFLSPLHSKEMNFDELKQLISSDEEFLILDVRTPTEYQGGHIPGAENISHDALPGNLESLSPNKNDLIVLYCRSGNRSGQAKRSLKAMGYTKLKDFGGIGNWKADLAY